MSDFLSKLASRSLNSNQGIRPRLAALFEPPSGPAVGFQRAPESGAASDGTGADESEIAFADREAADNAEAGRIFSPRRRRRVFNGVVANQDREGQMPIQDMLYIEDEQRISSIPQPRDLSRSSKMQDSHPQTTAPPVIPATVANPAGRLTESPRTHLSAPVPVPAAPKPSSLPEMGRLLPAVSPTAIFPELSRRDRHAAESQEGKGRGNIGSMQAASQTRQERRTMSSPAAESEPTIQVTIGRVEVRAELAETSSRRARQQPSPVMGLDEYLRHRSKRGGE